MQWRLIVVQIGISVHVVEGVFADKTGLNRTKRAIVKPHMLKRLWVGEQGQIRYHPGPDPKIMVVATPRASFLAHYRAALVASLMTRHMPSPNFESLAINNASIGVFAASERLSVWPEYVAHRDTYQCRGRCDGECKITCLTDGRKIDNLVGMASQMALVREDNLLCMPQDPYQHRENILVHEFAHTINYYLPQRLQSKIKAAYTHAKKNRLWNVASYGLSHHLEYFAEGTSAFFMVSKRGGTGDMNRCGANYCLTEMDARRRIKRKDPQLFEILSEVYTDNNPDQRSKLKICL